MDEHRRAADREYSDIPGRDTEEIRDETGEDNEELEEAEDLEEDEEEDDMELGKSVLDQERGTAVRTRTVE